MHESRLEFLYIFVHTSHSGMYINVYRMSFTIPHRFSQHMHCDFTVSSCTVCTKAFATRYALLISNYTHYVSVEVGCHHECTKSGCVSPYITLCKI